MHSLSIQNVNGSLDSDCTAPAFPKIPFVESGHNEVVAPCRQAKYSTYEGMTTPAYRAGWRCEGRRQEKS